MQSHIRKVYACLAVTCHLHFWQNDRDLLCATVEEGVWLPVWLGNTNWSRPIILWNAVISAQFISEQFISVQLHTQGDPRFVQLGYVTTTVIV